MGRNLQHLTEPAQPPHRYTTRPLPPYRHVPGLTPHPVTHPGGHSFGAAEPIPSPECRQVPQAWPRCREYLYGVDLFNRRFLWEAHEAWEIVWIGAGKKSGPAKLAQGLIQTSAGLLRLHLGTPGGADRLLAKGGENLDLALRLLGDCESTAMGIDLTSWRAAVGRYVESAAGAFPFLLLRMPAD